MIRTAHATYLPIGGIWYVQQGRENGNKYTKRFLEMIGAER